MAQAIMMAKKEKTKGHEPMMLRIRSADRSPRESWSPDRTPGCLCQWVCQGVVTSAIVAHLACAARDHSRRRGSVDWISRTVSTASVVNRGHLEDTYDLQEALRRRRGVMISPQASASFADTSERNPAMQA
jgi:hypothetical protein